MLIGSVYIGSTKVFEFNESWKLDEDEGIFTCTGRLTVYASKVARNPIRPFIIKIAEGTEQENKFTLYGILLRCTGTLEIKIIEKR